jgi:2-keto-4-pentenoate hydratase/2-oxohepta-3-ene-1,7-dioic acid hydratase in catechol pathway
MKLASFRHAGRDSFGAVVGENIVDLGRRLADRYPDLRALLAGDGIATAAQAVRNATSDIPISQITWRPVIPNPDKVVCVGLNYKAHVQEVGRKMEEQPVLFLRLPSSHVGHLQPIVRPKVSEQFDYEGELAVIVGRPGRHVAAAEALEHVAGYSIYNDGSVRDWQRHTHQYTPGKNFADSGAFGPFMVTADEIPDPRKLRLTTRLNGQRVQDTLVDDLLFTIEHIVSYVSSFTPLTPGDVIVTGTPSGVGAARKPPLWMKPGDVIEVSIDAIGTLRNSVVQEA